jgi:3-oxoacyl-[acyl-carrier protein] reductase
VRIVRRRQAVIRAFANDTEHWIALLVDFAVEDSHETMRQYFDLTDRTALVTGASSGIGAAAAVVLAGLGARVAIGYHHNAKGAEATRDRIKTDGGSAVAIRADVRRPEDVRALVDRAVAELGPIDILVNNAGSLVGRFAIREITEEHLDEVLALNLKSAVLASKAVVPAMIEKTRGAIINVVSIAGHNGGGPGAGAYAAAKAALTAYTKSMAKELAPHNVRVNAVSPGVIDTPFHETFSTPEIIQTFVKAIPMGRVGTSEECATVIAFLASDAASYIAGETIEVNGGQLMR